MRSRSIAWRGIVGGLVWTVTVTAAGAASPSTSEFLGDRSGSVPGEWIPAPLREEAGVQPATASTESEETQSKLGDLQPQAASRWLGDVLVSDPSYEQVEPALDKSPDGTLFIAAEDHGTADGWVRVFRSVDGGATWAWLVSFKTGTASRNPSITYARRPSGEDWIYLAYAATFSDSTTDVLVIRFDPDNPLSWNPVTVAADLTATPDIYPRVTTDNLVYADNYYVYVTYAVNAVDNYATMFARSVDYGLTYSAPQNVTGASESSSFVPHPDVTYGSAGLFIAFEKPGWTGSTWLTQVWVTRSTNFGTSWGTPVQLTSSAYGAWHPAVSAATGLSSVLVAYTRGYATETDIECAYSTDGGGSYSMNHSLPWTYDVEKAVDLTVSDSAGRYHAAFWRNYDIHYTYTDAAAPGTWAATTVVNDTNQASSTYGRPAICVNPTKPQAEEAAVAWTDYRGTYQNVYFDAGFHDGACCFPGECTETVESECLEAGGTWMGSGVGCEPIPCTDPCEDDVLPPVAALSLGDFQCVAVSGSTALSGTADDPDGHFDSWLLEERGMGAAVWTLVASGTYPVHSSVLANWTPAAGGYRMLRLTALDSCGHATTAVRLTYADAGPYATINYPTSGGVVAGNAVCIDSLVGHGVCGMSWTLSYRPLGGTWIPLASGSNAVYNLPIANWNTTLVPDGQYELRLSATSVGGTATHTVGVTVDNSIPIANLDLPVNCSWVDGTVEIYGDALDANLTQWALQWTGGPSNGWNPITSGSSSVSGLLATWDVSGLPECAYTVRLLAHDAAIVNCTGNVHWTEYLASVNVGEPGGDADLDGDGDVDLEDFALFAQQFTGPG